MIVCMNVDIFSAQEASNTNIPIQVNISPVVMHLQASQWKCTFVWGLISKMHLIQHKITGKMWQEISAYQKNKGLCSPMETFSLVTQGSTQQVALQSCPGASLKPKWLIREHQRENMQTVHQKHTKPDVWGRKQLFKMWSEGGSRKKQLKWLFNTCESNFWSRSTENTRFSISISPSHWNGMRIGVYLRFRVKNIILLSFKLVFWYHPETLEEKRENEMRKTWHTWMRTPSVQTSVHS